MAVSIIISCRLINIVTTWSLIPASRRCESFQKRTELRRGRCSPLINISRASFVEISPRSIQIANRFENTFPKQFRSIAREAFGRAIQEDDDDLGSRDSSF